MTRINTDHRERSVADEAVDRASVARFAPGLPRPKKNRGRARLEEITVTGSRITRDGMNSPTPITAITADDMQMMAPGQFIDSLDYLPPFFMNDAPDTAASKSESAGAANVNLRGLGANRTLVLLDGRRMVPSNRLGAVDINLFPEAMVERVEVVTGGASAVYGTDAVAGVVNFILKDDFEGFDIHTQFGAHGPQRWREQRKCRSPTARASASAAISWCRASGSTRTRSKRSKVATGFSTGA